MDINIELEGDNIYIYQCVIAFISSFLPSEVVFHRLTYVYKQHYIIKLLNKHVNDICANQMRLGFEPQCTGDIIKEDI